MTASSDVLAAGAIAQPQTTAVGVNANDALGRALADALARRTSEAGAAWSERYALLSRCGTKKKRSREVEALGNPELLSGAKRQRVNPHLLDEQRHWSYKVGSSQKVAGGTSVRADLGPVAGQPTKYGSKPGPGECTAVNWLNANRYGDHLWIKGHLLNDNLGGAGISENLTPMTHQANMQYKTFEASIKKAIEACYSRAINADKGKPPWYGVRVEIRVEGQQWPDGQNANVRAVADHVKASAKYIEKTVIDKGPEPITKPAWAPALVAPDNYPCVVEGLDEDVELEDVDD